MVSVLCTDHSLDVYDRIIFRYFSSRVCFLVVKRYGFLCPIVFFVGKAYLFVVY